jgi:capsular polysaccharide biosynthesis protein
MKELFGVGILLAIIVGGVLALAPRLSGALLRAKARRLPGQLSERMGEEWLAELGALPGRPSQLAFAIALALTRRHSFAIEDEGVFAVRTRWPMTLATFGGWPTVVLFTTVVMAGIAYAASFLITPLYRSHTRILVVPQRVAARFVEPASRTSLEDRLQMITETILNRTRLERIIREFNLYERERKVMIMEDVFEQMRQDITVDVLDGTSFDVAYVSANPRTAMLVTERLATLFINENLQDRSVLVDVTIQFLDAQIGSVRSRLLRRPNPGPLSQAAPADPDVQALQRESLKATYRDLLIKREQARHSANMERQQIGEQFKVLDGARLPEAPVSPDRPRLTLLGAVAGLCLGIALMFAGRDGWFRRPNRMLAQS